MTGPSDDLPSPPRGKRGSPGTLQLDIPPLPVPVDDITKQDRTTIAESWHKLSKLVTSVGKCNRRAAIEQHVAAEELRERLVVAEVSQPKLLRERPVPGEERRRRHRGRVEALKKAFGKLRVAIVEIHWAP